MRLMSCREQFTRLMRKVSLAKMLAEVDTTSMYTFTQEQEHTYAERNLLLLRALRASQVAPDSSLPFQQMLVYMVAQLL